jgi:small-conductance mechanosensitive channel
MSNRTVEALAIAGAGVVAVVLVRWGLGVLFGRLERRIAQRDPSAIARRRTTFNFLRRVIVAFVAVIAIWNVLSLYPATDRIASALLASSAVLALIAGLAFQVPLSNLGAGLLVSFAQPLRLGDRVTIGEHTGFVDEMSLLYTTLVTDQAGRVYIPNTQLTTSTIVNRTIRDPRRIVSARFPLRLGGRIDDARGIALDAAGQVQGLHPDATQVLVDEVETGAVWLTVTASAPLHADVIQLGSDLREAVLDALGEADALAA